ncbi:MAG: EpsI family protein [Phycisphaerae bacterium]
MTPQAVEKSRRPSLKAAAVAAVLLIGVGVGHRALMARMQFEMSQSLKLRAPLATIPTELGAWRGVEKELEDQILRKVGDDDRLSREYHRDADRRTVALYVGYIGRPRMWHGHRVDVCYPANGWKQENLEKTTVAAAGRTLPALVYEYRAPQLGGPRDLILVMYLINGEFVNDPERAKDYNLRSTGLIRQSEAYIARIQIVTRATGDRARDVAALTDFAALIVGPVIDLMPTFSSTSN